MDKANHTPGPWRQHHKGATRVIANVPGEENELHTICNTWSSPLSPPRSEAAANAALIAAAPDLLAVCEALLDPLRTNTLKEIIRAAAEAVAKVKV